MACRTMCRRVLLVQQGARAFSCTGARLDHHHRLVVLGGGTGGCAVASRACKKLGQGNVAIVEPAKHHFNQAMWTLVGGGIKQVDRSERLMEDVIPKQCVLYKQRVDSFDPENNSVTLSNGEKIRYDFLVVAMGIQLDYYKIDGLLEALRLDPSVCSNYWRQTVTKTFPAIKAFEGGEAIFTFPNTPVKCAGAPQKIMYLAEDYWKKNGIRDKVNINYMTSPAVIFGVAKYAEVLRGVCDRKNITVNYRHSLKSIDHRKKEATFELLDSPDGETVTKKYDMIHVAPPMSAPDPLKNSPIADASGFVDVNKNTLQHVKYSNIFAIGDCSNVPTSKTAAAVACQNKQLFTGLMKVMKGQPADGKYDGYTSCPLLTSYKTCVLAEFDFDGKPLETFPLDQGKERVTMFYLKKDIMPHIYWKMLTKGYWSGPSLFRKIFKFGFSR